MGIKSTVLFLALSLCVADAQAALHIQKKATHVPGQLIVRLKNALPGNRVQANLISALQGVMGQASVADLVPFQTDSSLYKMSLGSDKQMALAMKLLGRESSVVSVEPNILFHALDDGAPNDPDFGKLWGMHNIGQADSVGQIGTPGSDIGVLGLWQAGITGSRNILVAVVDTGVDWTHPDLIENLYTNPGEAGELATNGIDDDANGFIDDVHGWNFVTKKNDSNDDQGHGTHVAGTIGAVGNNGVGVAGVNWQASILPIKFLDASGGGTLEGAVEAVNYAAMMKARVINASWGGGSSAASLEEAVRKSGEAGVLFVAAAGNDGTDNDTKPMYPAGYKFPNVMAVAATDNQDKLGSFSNYGKKTVHVAAPGVKILSTTKNGSYATYSGTSMAAPHAAGVAALLLSVSPELDYAAVKERLIKTSEPVMGLGRKVVSHGRLSAFNAVHNIVPPSNDPDESAWQDVTQVIESEHPYLDKTNQTFEVSFPGAKFIRVHFEKIETEKSYDIVSLETDKGEVIEKLSGFVTNYMTDYIAGDHAVIRLKADLSKPGWGFKVDRIQVIQ